MKPGRYKLHDPNESITVLRARYHRNGVGGEGFCALRFTFEGQELIGIVTEHPKTSKWDSGFEAYVINPRNLADTKRGHDYFGPALFRATQARRAELHSWESDEVAA